MAQPIRCAPSKEAIGSSNMRPEAARDSAAAWLGFLGGDDMNVGKGGKGG